MIMYVKCLVPVSHTNSMMSKDQVEIVRIVYTRFIESEDQGWTEIDDNLEMYGWLSNEELVKEAKIKCLSHSKGTFKCTQKHEQQNCFAPRILEAVEAVLSLYDRTKELHPKNAYILTYYLVMSELKMVFSI